MKISKEQLERFITEEINKLQPELQEGVLDYLKGAGSEIGKRAKSFAGDVKNAGAVASLKSDLKRASGEAGVQIERLITVFNDLLARAQSLRMDVEEKEIKAELQALRNYQETASAELGSSSVPNKLQAPVQSQPVQQQAVSQQAKTTPSPVLLPPMPTKQPAVAAKATPTKTSITKTPSKKKTTPKPALDKTAIQKAYKDNKGDVRALAKKLGVSHDDIIKALS